MKVMIFDDAAQKMVLEFTCPTPVLGVRMKRDKVSNISWISKNDNLPPRHSCFDNLPTLQDCDCDEEPDPRVLLPQLSHQAFLS